MAAPQRRELAALPTEPAWPVRKRAPDGGERDAAGRKAAGRRRSFAALVVVPVLLMLGSVYLHTVAGGLNDRVVVLQNDLDRARAQGERLDVRVAELSGAERIRPLAAERLGMRAPESSDMEVYGREGEDGTQNRGEQEGGEPRRR